MKSSEIRVSADGWRDSWSREGGDVNLIVWKLWEVTAEICERLDRIEARLAERELEHE